MKKKPHVSCILVNWNGWQDTMACLDALAACDHPNLDIIVVDNGSTDGSVVEIASSYRDITLLRSESNLGFAGGNNIGIRHAFANDAEYVWLLNNDTKPDSHALSALLAQAESNLRIGAVASVCYYADSPSVVQVWAGAKVNLWIGYGRNSIEPHPNDWFDALYGASILIKRAVIDEIGMLDEGFFHYWEETEFCLRLRKAGWLLAAAPMSRILHKVNASTGQNNPILDRYFTASGLRILSLHSPAPYFAMPFFLAVRFIRRIMRFQFQKCKSVWEGVKDYRQSKPIIQKIR